MEALQVKAARNVRPWAAILLGLLIGFAAYGEDRISLATLNCYWFFNGNESNGRADLPRTRIDYTTKAGHLIGLLPDMLFRPGSMLHGLPVEGSWRSLSGTPGNGRFCENISHRPW